MKLAVVGSRDFTDYTKLKLALDNINQFFLITEIISGGAKGADSLAERYAKENNIKLTIYLPDWKRYGRPAGMIRNKEIVSSATSVIAFWDGKSKGTANSISLAEKSKKLRQVILYEDV